MRVLITGMSGTGKSAVVSALRAAGLRAVDADADGYTEPRPHGAWGWRTDLVDALFADADDGLVILAGCSEEQATYPFDLRILLTAPEPVIMARLHARSTNDYGKREDELARVRADLRDVEPLLRRSADLVIDTTRPLPAVVDAVVGAIRTARALD